MARVVVASVAAAAVVSAGCAVAAVTPDDPPPGATQDPACKVSSTLVNSCRPWLGAAANGYPDAQDGLRAQVEGHEQRIGRKVDIVHTYASPGKLPLSNDADRHFANRSGTYLFQNWKPTAKWSEASGSDSAVNAHIDKAAQRVKDVAPKKIFMTLHHEPENDVTQGSADGCATASGGKAGSPQDYVEMWSNVRTRFEKAGVTNVVWVMDYMNYPKWNCLAKKLYPGNDRVDWVMFNAYGSKQHASFNTNVERFIKLLPEIGVEDKPLGIVEWGVHTASQQQVYAYYDEARKAIADNRFPALKAYMIFDSPGPHEQGGLRVLYDDAGAKDPQEAARYEELAKAIQ